jgi:hypothetical protein
LEEIEYYVAASGQSIANCQRQLSFTRSMRSFSAPEDFSNTEKIICKFPPAERSLGRSVARTVVTPRCSSGFLSGRMAMTDAEQSGLCLLETSGAESRV